MIVGRAHVVNKAYVDMCFSAVLRVNESDSIGAKERIEA